MNVPVKLKEGTKESPQNTKSVDKTSENDGVLVSLAHRGPLPPTPALVVIDFINIVFVPQRLPIGTHTLSTTLGHMSTSPNRVYPSTE